MPNILFRRFVKDESAFSPGDMNVPSLDLEKNILLERGKIVSSADKFTYLPATGQLTWTTDINIFWTDDKGISIKNTVSPGNVILTDGEFAYIDLNIVDGQGVSVSKVAMVSGEASEVMPYLRVVLGYRDGDEFCSTILNPEIRNYLLEITSYSLSSVSGNPPYQYQNTNSYPVDVIISGGVVSKIEFSRGDASGIPLYDVGFISGIVGLSPLDVVYVTWSETSGVPNPIFTIIPR